MESKQVPSSLAVLTSPQCKNSDATTSLDSKALTSLSAANIQLMASQTGIEQLLSLAHLHVDNAMAAQYIRDKHEAGFDDGGFAMMTSEEKKTSIIATLPQTVIDAVRKLRRSARSKVSGNGAVPKLTAAEVGEARYKRLKAGFTRLQDHLKCVAEHREQLLRGLDQFHASTTCLREVIEDLAKLPASSSEFSSSLSVSFVATETMKNVLEHKVAQQTSQKLAELKLFEAKLDERDQLRSEADKAERQLQVLRADNLKRGHHANKNRATAMHDIAVKRQEFQQLRRRLAVMTEALEHVFQFHFQLDQCVAEPELETVRSQVLLFFRQNRLAFDALLVHQ